MYLGMHANMRPECVKGGFECVRGELGDANYRASKQCGSLSTVIQRGKDDLWHVQCLANMYSVSWRWRSSRQEPVQVGEVLPINSNSLHTFPTSSWQISHFLVKDYVRREWGEVPLLCLWEQSSERAASHQQPLGRLQVSQTMWSEFVWRVLSTMCCVQCHYFLHPLPPFLGMQSVVCSTDTSIRYWNPPWTVLFTWDDVGSQFSPGMGFDPNLQARADIEFILQGGCKAACS